MAKTLFVLLSFILISQSHAQDGVVEPKLVITNPGGGGYNLDQRVYELEKSNQSLNQAVKDAYFRTSALERRLVELERKLNQGGYNNGGGYGATLRCEMYVGASSLVETGSDQYETEQRLREGCRRELKVRECDYARVNCRRAR